MPLLRVAGILVALTIRHLPGGGGHKPAEGLKTGGTPPVAAVPGVVLAAIASLSPGVVLGPGLTDRARRRIRRRRCQTPQT
ncbi:hypothetical protein ACFXG6_25545 [Streptomyces roseus]|uniref:hypothetical protein n=1 Tax=Streptomyces roseus TaxID=66430 RepID=UPI00369BDEBD